MASAPNEKSAYKPPEEFALLPRDHRPIAPYPPPYSDNHSTVGVHNLPPQPGPYPPGATMPAPGAYPVPPPGSYSIPQPGYGMPQVSYGPPQPPGSMQGEYRPRPMQGIYAPGGGGPITMQPTSWMAVPENVPNCPRGLEFLSTVDQLLVHQEIEMFELMTGFETENKYSVLNSLGQRVYYAAEESDCCGRNCCGASRAFNMKIMDNYGTTVINLSRPLACQSCCSPCCLQTMEVTAPPGSVIGTIEQLWTLCYPKLAIKNSSGDTILYIDGPCCTMACCGGDVEFQLMSSDRNRQVGKICKKWSGYGQEAYTDADNFGISFPMDLDVKMKAVVLGACFLIDMMYYESAPNQRRR